MEVNDEMINAANKVILFFNLDLTAKELLELTEDLLNADDV